MRETLMDKIRHGLRDWLQIESTPYSIKIRETTDFELSAIRNRIWYRGDSNELYQLYAGNGNPYDFADKYKFWASHSSPGMEMRKIHTGLPGMIVRMLTAIVLGDMNDFEFADSSTGELWDQIDKDNQFRKGLTDVLSEALVVGDGAFRISLCTDVSSMPIVDWVPGDRVEYVVEHGRLKEVVFKTPIYHNKRQYVLNEYYGKGYIRPELTDGENILDMSALPEITGVPEGGWTFSDDLMLAVPFKVYKSSKYKNRGASIYDGKIDNFDAFDEAWSQWMDALRAGRANTYIPEDLIPRDPNTGLLMKPNPFDNRFIATGSNMSEGADNKIVVEQPGIPHDSYIATYTAALDLCLQGLISPSTLGIDTKKLDNAEAQREKEKTTLYTRNAIVDALQETIPSVIRAAIGAYDVMNHVQPREVKVDIPFGEYANPSFESQVETVAKAKTGGIMSINAAVDELYGDTKDRSWKETEVKRLKEEAGVMETEEPALNLEGLDIE